MNKFAIWFFIQICDLFCDTTAFMAKMQPNWFEVILSYFCDFFATGSQMWSKLKFVHFEWFLWRDHGHFLWFFRPVIAKFPCDRGHDLQNATFENYQLMKFSKQSHKNGKCSNFCEIKQISCRKSHFVFKSGCILTVILSQKSPRMYIPILHLEYNIVNASWGYIEDFSFKGRDKIDYCHDSS